MSEAKHYQTAPQDRVPFLHKVIYGSGAFVNNLLAYAMGGMIIVLNLGLGIDPVLVGFLGMLPRLMDAFTDPIMGYLSDNTRSRWGRRRPYIFAGAIAVALVFVLLWQLPQGKSDSFVFWYFLAGSLLFYLAYTVFATPWVALGYELTADYHERTRLMATQNFIGQFPYIVGPYFLLIMQSEMFGGDMVEGAGGLAIVIAVVVVSLGILPAIFLRERFTEAPEREDADGAEAKKDDPGIMGVINQFFVGFMTTIKFMPFLKLCVVTFLVFNGFMLVASFQFYVIIYYVFGGDTVAGAEFSGHAGALAAVSTLAIIVMISWLGPRFGKRKVFFFTTGVSVIGYLSKWFCYSPDMPWMVLLPAPLMAFGLGGLFTLMPSMIADVVDADELETYERREGMYGSIFWWVVKLGMAAALLAGGFLLNATGFDVELGTEQTERTLTLMRLFDAVIPAAASLIAIWLIATYSITEERAHEVRKLLEERRGNI